MTRAVLIWLGLWRQCGGNRVGWVWLVCARRRSHTGNCRTAHGFWFKPTNERLTK